MIDLKQEVIARMTEITPITGRVFRENPAEDGMAGMPYMILSDAGHTTVHRDDDGQELLAQLTYTARVFAHTQREADNIGDAVKNLFNRMGFDIIGNSTPYSEINHAHTVLMTVTAKADRRGATYR